MVRSIRKSVQPATVFVDAEDFRSLSLAQKQEYLIVARSNKALHVVVYNERGQEDSMLKALLGMDHVTRTEDGLSPKMIARFAPANIPAIHLSRNVLPDSEVVRAVRNKVAFFKTKSEKSGTLATALLWALSGGEKARVAGVKEEDGFWTVEETLLTALQRTYDSNFVIAIAA